MPPIRMRMVIRAGAPQARVSTGVRAERRAGTRVPAKATHLPPRMSVARPAKVGTKMYK